MSTSVPHETRSGDPDGYYADKRSALENRREYLYDGAAFVKGRWKWMKWRMLLMREAAR